MPERSQDLEWYREQFLGQLHSSRVQLTGHGEFVRYWKLVEKEAEQTEELGKLESWVKNLARDKEKVRALKGRLEGMQEHSGNARALLALIRQILELLEEIERKLRVRRDIKRRIMGFLIFRAGPGVKKKVKPGEGDVGKGKGEDGDEAKVSETVLSKPKPKVKKPKKKMAR